MSNQKLVARFFLPLTTTIVVATGDSDQHKLFLEEKDLTISPLMT